MPRTLADWFEVISRAVFNAGLAWQVVEAHWPALTDAFAGWSPEVVAAFDDRDITRVLARDDVIQSDNKVRGTVENARTFVGLVEGSNGFAGWLHAQGEYPARQAALVEQFRWLGEFGAYWVHVTAGEDHPPYTEWAPAHGHDLPASLDG